MVRKYQFSDIDSCRGLWAELTQRHRDIYADPTIGRDDPGMGFDLYIKNEKLRGPWVAEVDALIVGFAGLLVEGEEADVKPVARNVEDRNNHSWKRVEILTDLQILNRIEYSIYTIGSESHTIKRSCYFYSDGTF